MSNEQTTRNLLDSVTKDVSTLRRDIASLLSHTGRRTIPDGARELADYGKDRLHAGSEFAASQLRNLRHLRAQPTQTTAGITGGLVLLGAVGLGIYYLCKSDCCKSTSENDECDLTEESKDGSLPSYIS